MNVLHALHALLGQQQAPVQGFPGAGGGDYDGPVANSQQLAQPIGQQQLQSTARPMQLQGGQGGQILQAPNSGGMLGGGSLRQLLAGHQAHHSMNIHGGSPGTPLVMPQGGGYNPGSTPFQGSGYGPVGNTVGMQPALSNPSQIQGSFQNSQPSIQLY